MSIASSSKNAEHETAVLKMFKKHILRVRTYKFTNLITVITNSINYWVEDGNIILTCAGRAWICGHVVLTVQDYDWRGNYLIFIEGRLVKDIVSNYWWVLDLEGQRRLSIMSCC